MSLSVKKFLNMRPQLPFRFSVDITDDLTTWNNDYLNVSVKSVKVNLGESDLTEGAIYYGDGYFTVPIFNPAERSLEISFTESDDMSILKFFDSITAEQFHKTPKELFVRVTEYDETFTYELSKILYTCFLKEYSEPAFNRTGGVNIATIDATFVVTDMKDELGKEVQQNKTIKTEETKEKTDSDYRIDKIVADILDTLIGDQKTQDRLKNKKDWLSPLLDDGLVDIEKLEKFLIENFTGAVYRGEWYMNEFRAAVEKTESIFKNVNTISADLKTALNESDTIKDNELKNKDGSWNARKLDEFIATEYHKEYEDGVYTLDELKYAAQITTGEYKKKWEKKK